MPIGSSIICPSFRPFSRLHCFRSHSKTTSNWHGFPKISILTSQAFLFFPPLSQRIPPLIQGWATHLSSGVHLLGLCSMNYSFMTGISSSNGPIFPAQKRSPLCRFLHRMTFTDSFLFLIPQLFPDPQRSAFCLLCLNQRPPCYCPGTFRCLSCLHPCIPSRPFLHCLLTALLPSCYFCPACHLLLWLLFPTFFASFLSLWTRALSKCHLLSSDCGPFSLQFMVFERAFLVLAGMWKRTGLKNSK